MKSAGMARMLRVLAMSLLLFIVLPGLAAADRGAMSFLPWVDVFEPAQKAIIAWNGQEQYLLLSTDLRASQPTRVLEVLPLPSAPVISRGDVKVFSRINALINRHMNDFSRSKGPAQIGMAAEVTFHEKIGAHDITVLHVLDSTYFEEWVIDYLRKQGVAGYKISPVMLATIEQYLLDGHKWFVFDVVELGTSLKSNDAIQYRFASDKMYYPLRISGNAKGRTDISLTVLSPTGLTRYMGIPQDRIQQQHPPVAVDHSEVLAIHQEMANLFDRSGKITLQTLHLQGDLAEFDLDVLAR